MGGLPHNCDNWCRSTELRQPEQNQIQLTKDEANTNITL